MDISSKVGIEVTNQIQSERLTRPTPAKRRRRRRGVTGEFETAAGWHRGFSVTNLIRWVLLIVVVLIFLLPFWSVLVNAFDRRVNSSVFHLWPTDFSFVSWATAIDQGILLYLANSFVILGGGLLIQLMTTILASYAFARYRFRGAAFAFGIFLLTMMLPEDIIAIPLNQVLGDLPLLGISLRGTPFAVILPVAAWGFSVLLMTEFMKEIPREIEDAARLDGAGDVRVLFNVILPMSTPVIGVATIFGFIMIWDQYLLPLITATSPDDYTLTVALRLLNQDVVVGQGVVMVGTVLALLPSVIAFLLLQKSLIRGVASGAVKG